MDQRLERAVCEVWSKGGLTWIEAVDTLRLRHLADLYALSYRRGVLPGRPLAEEASLPLVYLVPWRWLRYPEWRHHWKQRLRDNAWPADSIERVTAALDAGEDPAGMPYTHDHMWREMQAEAAALSASIAARRTELDEALRAAVANLERQP